jgi:hypothetical protein
MTDWILLFCWSAVCLALAFLCWRWLIVFFFLFLCFQGYLANYFYPLRAPLEAHLVMISALYVGFMLSGQVLRIRGFATLPLGLLLCSAVFQLLNPEASGLAVSGLGFLLLFSPIPLIWVACSYFDEKARLIDFLYFNVLVSLVPSLVGVAEYFWGPSSVLPLGGRYIPYATPGGPQLQYVRVASTFASPGLFSGYLMAIVLFCVVLLWSARLARRKRIVVFLCLASAGAGLLAAGTRSAFVAVGAMLALLLWYRSALKKTLSAALVLISLFAGGLWWFGERVQYRFADISWEQVWDRFYGLFWYRFTELAGDHPWGFGLGTASVASRHLTNGAMQFPLVESYFLKLTYEIGVQGLVAWLVFVGALLIREAAILRRVQDHQLRWIGSALLIFQTVMFLLGFWANEFDAGCLPIFFWFFAGAVFKMSRWESERKPVKVRSQFSTALYAGSPAK